MESCAAEPGDQVHMLWARALSNLRYWNGTNWHTLPLWTTFFVSAGACLAANPVNGSRAVAVATVPTRLFCAPFAALGALLSSISASPKVDPHEHFKNLCRLNPASQVGLTFTHNGRRFDGVFAGVLEVGGERFIRVRVQATASDRTGGAAFLVSEKNSLKVAIHDEGAVSLGNRYKGRRLSGLSDFTTSFFTESGAAEPSDSRGRCEVLIVGKINALRDEITQERIGFLNKGNILEGCLQGILQVRKFASSGDQGLVDVASGSRTAFGVRLHARTIIFDDLPAYLKYRDQFRASNLLVILERTDSRFNEAVSEANAEYLKRSADLNFRELARIPSGVELMAYLEKSRS